MGNPNELEASRPARDVERDAKRARRQRALVWGTTALCVWILWNMRESAKNDNLEGPVSPPVSYPTCAPGLFDWDSIVPSETLEWTKCYQTPFQCARLVVPLDYAKPHGQKAAIALIKYPSKYPVGHESYRGPVLYNPGGPGGSGVSIVRALGAYFSTIIGDDYDHIGFDPRGLGFTTPGLQVFKTEVEQLVFAGTMPPTLNSTPDALARAYGGAKFLGDSVANTPPAKHVAQHMSTAIVARDMLSITRAHGRDKLQYWGFSYGSVLGVTYASMFPDNVGRLIVDGVVDTENYYSGAWDNNLMDTEAGLDIVLAECATSKSCALHAPTVAGVRAKLQAVLTSLKHEPLFAHMNSTGNYGIIDRAIAHAFLFTALYKPIGGTMSKLFDALAAANRADGEPFLHFLDLDNGPWSCPVPDSGSCGWTKGVNGAETFAAIACGDADVVHYDHLNDLIAFYQKMYAKSQFAEEWVPHATCAGWKIRPVERYHGPFIGNTSFPLLLIGNTADPVTPVWAARKMSKGFKDAVVLTQNSPGHCSLAASSLCTAKAIRAYFRDGVLPKAGTVCEIEKSQRIFAPDEPQVQDTSALSAEERELLEAVGAASAGFDVPRFGRATKL